MPDHLSSRRHFLKQLSLTSIALLPGVQTLGALVEPTYPGEPPAKFFIDKAYRLMYYQQMLELEFYFINVTTTADETQLKPLTSRRSRFRAYMVVRLPQQHIAEEYVDATCLREDPQMLGKELLESRIAGYSYLCFSIAYDQLEHGLPITAQELMNWNAPHFSLISKPGTDIKPFITAPAETVDDPRPFFHPRPAAPITPQNDLYAPDTYPLGFLNRHYARRYYPNQRNYSGGLRSAQDRETRQVRDQAPFTALEIPYRLILSPQLPSWEYDYHWVFTSFLGVTSCPSAPAPAELWMATLRARRKKGHSLSQAHDNAPTAAQTQADTPNKPPTDSEETVNLAENQLQFMILGPATNEEYTSRISQPNPLANAADPAALLPNAQDRLQLVQLSSNFDLSATAPSLAFTPLGACTQLAFRNLYFEKDLISLYQWKQAISFGRDQEVEVANVVVDATFGLKMLHVRTTRRETVQGYAPLLYREFLMPLELEKDFASYPNQDSSTAYQQENHKYATPFQRVRFPDASPRQILPLSRLQSDLCIRTNSTAHTAQNAAQTVVPPGSLRTGRNALLQAHADSLLLARRGIGKNSKRCGTPEPDELVLAFWAVTPDHQLLEWPMIFTDWRGQETTLRRRLYLLRSELNLNRDQKQATAVYGYTATTNEAAALTVGANSADIIPAKTDAVGHVTFNATALYLMATDGGVVETATAIWQQLNNAFDNLHLATEEKSRRLREVFEQIWKLDGLGKWTFAMIWADVQTALRKNSIGLGTEEAIKKLLEAATKIDPNDIWRSIRQQSEEFGLQTLDVLRGGIEAQLQTAEANLVAISTAGIRDVEDAVLEEWGRYKRSLLGVDLTWEAQLWQLLHKAEDLAEQAQRALTRAKEQNDHDLQVGLQKLVDDVRLNILDRTSPTSLYSRIEMLLARAMQGRVLLDVLKAQADTLSKELLHRFEGYLADSITRTGTSVIIYIIPSAVSNYQDFATYLKQVRERVTAGVIRELGPAYEYAQFVNRLPAAIQQEVRDEISEQVAQVRAFGTYIGHFEQTCKSRIDAAKAELCYAVHQAEDEMEVLKRALDAKYQRQSAEWKAAWEKFSRDFGQAASGHLATMRTDFLVFRNNLRLVEVQGTAAVKQRVFDVFNSYPCYPQLHTAQVYAGAINDLARREIPIKIKYAQEYVRHQLDNVGLEVKNNAARLFAEVHQEAQELLKGAMREAGKELGGLVNPEVAGRYLTLLKDGSAKAQATLDALQRDGQELATTLRQQGQAALQTANTELNTVLSDYARSREAATQEFNRLQNGVLTLSEAAKQELKAAEQDVQVQAGAFFKGLEAKILGSIRLRDLLGADFNLPKLTRLPDKVSYQFLTRGFKPFDVKVFRFVPNERTTLQAYLEIPTRHPEDFRSQTQLSDFTISIFDDRLLVEFKRIELLSTRDVKNKTSVELGQIGFGKELEFLAALAKGFMIPGTGLKVQPSPTDISITYALPIPGVSGGAFTFDNLKVNVGLSIPIPSGLGATNQPLAIKFGLNGPTDPFVIGVLIFGGMGHFLIETTPKYLKRVDTGLSFGGLFRINLGIAVGQAFLQAGIRYVYERQPTGEAVIELFCILTCGANVTVFGFIEISVVFTMYLKYRKDSAGTALYGVASVACSVRVGFFSKSFTLTFSKRFAGASAPPAVATRTRRTPLPAVAGQPAENNPSTTPSNGYPSAPPRPTLADTLAQAPLRETLAERPPVRVQPLPMTAFDRWRLNRLEKRRNNILKRMQTRLGRVERRLDEARLREYERQAAYYRKEDELANSQQAQAQLQYLYETYSFTSF